MATVVHETVSYEEFLDQQIRRVQHWVKAEDVGSSSLKLAAAAVFYLVAAVALDHLLALPALARTALLAVALSAAIYYAFRAILTPALRSVTELYAGRVVDRAVEELNDGLTTILDLKKRSDDPLANLARPVVEERVVRVLSRILLEEHIAQQRLVQAACWLAAAVLMACVAVLINSFLVQRSLGASLLRVLCPWVHVEYPTRTRLVDVEPGDDPRKSRGIAGSNVTIRVMVQGKVPDRVVLHWSDDGGQYWRQQDLSRPTQLFEPWQTTLTAVEKSFIYYLEGGDCRTKMYSFEVVPVPIVKNIELLYEFPAYTRRPSVRSQVPDIDALEGTRVTITAQMSGPVRSAYLVLGPNKDDRRPMHRLPGAQHTVQGVLTVEKDDVYRIWFELETGDINPNPPVHQIRCRKDQPPEVKIIEPGRDLVNPPVGLDAKVPVRVSAQDDFALRTVTLFIETSRGQSYRESLMEPTSEQRETFEGTCTLDLSRFGLQAGQELTYWAEVFDARRPQPNRSTSEKYRIRVGNAPPSPSQSASVQPEEPKAPPKRQQPEQGSTSESSRSGGEPPAAQDGGSAQRSESPNEGANGQQDAPKDTATKPADQPGDTFQQEAPRVMDEKQALEEILKYFQSQEVSRQGSQEGQGRGGGQQNQQAAADQQQAPRGGSQPGTQEETASRDLQKGSQEASSKGSGAASNQQKPQQEADQPEQGKPAGTEPTGTSGSEQGQKSPAGDTPDGQQHPVRPDQARDDSESGSPNTGDSSKPAGRDGEKRQAGSGKDRANEPPQQQQRGPQQAGSGKPPAFPGGELNPDQGSQGSKTSDSASGGSQKTEPSGPGASRNTPETTEKEPGAAAGEGKPQPDKALSDSANDHKGQRGGSQGRDDAGHSLPPGAGPGLPQGSNQDGQGTGKPDQQTPPGGMPQASDGQPQAKDQASGGSDAKPDASAPSDRPGSGPATPPASSPSTGSSNASEGPTSTGSKPEGSATEKPGHGTGQRSQWETQSQPGVCPVHGPSCAEKGNCEEAKGPRGQNASARSGPTNGRQGLSKAAEEAQQQGGSKPADEPQATPQGRDSVPKTRAAQADPSGASGDKGSAKDAGQPLSPSGSPMGHEGEPATQAPADANKAAPQGSPKPAGRAAGYSEGGSSGGKGSNPGTSNSPQSAGAHPLRGGKPSNAGGGPTAQPGSAGSPGSGGSGDGSGYFGRSTPAAAAGQRSPKPLEQGSGPEPQPSQAAGMEPADQQREDGPRSAASQEPTELVLTRLQETLRQDRVDSELLKRLGWTKEELERFVQRLRAQRTQNQTPPAAMGSGGTVRSVSSLVRSTAPIKDDQSAADAGRAPLPPEYRELIEAYTRSLSEASSSP